MRTKLGYKVPRREVYCETFGGWLRQTAWCHVVMKVFPAAFDFGTQFDLDRALSCSHDSEPMGAMKVDA